MEQQGIPEEILSDTRLITHLAAVAKDAALLNGVLMRTKEEPDSSEVSDTDHFFFSDLRTNNNKVPMILCVHPPHPQPGDVAV